MRIAFAVFRIRSKTDKLIANYFCKDNVFDCDFVGVSGEIAHDNMADHVGKAITQNCGSGKQDEMDKERLVCQKKKRMTNRDEDNCKNHLLDFLSIL